MKNPETKILQDIITQLTNLKFQHKPKYHVSKNPHIKIGLFHRSQNPLSYYVYSTNLNLVPNAQVCVFDGTYYKIISTNYISKTSPYTTFRMYPSGPWPLKILIFALLVTCEIAKLTMGKRPKTANICWVCC